MKELTYHEDVYKRQALAIARKNNDALEARVRFLQRDVLADDWKKIPSFDVIVSNRCV